MPFYLGGRIGKMRGIFISPLGGAGSRDREELDLMAAEGVR